VDNSGDKPEEQAPRLSTKSGNQENITHDLPEPTAPSIMQRYPELVQPAGTNWFHKAFKLPAKARSRMQSLFAPIADLLHILDPSRGIRDFMDGNDIRYDVDQKDAQAVQALLEKGKEVLASINKALIAREKKDGIVAKLNAGTDIVRWRDLKALNILEKIGNDYDYNQNLIQGAVVAGIDWLLNVGNRQAKLTDDDVAGIMGLEFA
jgi:hypothetical protein